MAIYLASAWRSMETLSPSVHLEKTVPLPASMVTAQTTVRPPAVPSMSSRASARRGVNANKSKSPMEKQETHWAVRLL